ncbi:MAG: DUF1667 domain-containing protein [Clostridia bacterium]|nr:DUF1667 domain-containing protein [Clostridia bacterium]
MQGKEMICIVCPLGCRMKVSKNEGGYDIAGNKCLRGEDYGIKELTNPTRILTTTVKIKNGLLSRIPVKTKEPIPKSKIFQCMKVINSVEVEAPISVGDVVIKDICGTGIDIVVSRSMEESIN